jgi:hypothetical protein|tara:strand:- start:114 stop:821 length:708 start_codon:yes stop_codon:yes gene_type:complete
VITEDSIIKDIPKNKHSEFLEELMKHYIDKQGLGGIPKTDFDALLVYLYTIYSGKAFDVFSLSQRFMVKEARIKSLYETGLIKYSDFTEGKAWIEILEKLKTTKFQLESNERGQVRFKFENPALYKYFQKRLRVIGGTAPYSSASETVTIPLDTLFELVEHIYDESQTQFSTAEMEQIHLLIEPVISKVTKSLGKKKITQLKGKEGLGSKAGKALDAAIKMENIGRFLGVAIAAL